MHSKLTFYQDSKYEGITEPLDIWAVTEKHNDVPIGICGFIPLEEDDNQYEISYRLLPDFQGKGLATEAAMAVRDYAAGI